MEQVSIGIKLAIIAGLLVGLAFYSQRKAVSRELVVNLAIWTGWSALTLAFGLIATMQGFETSRFLRADCDATVRIRSMRYAQLLSAAIYMVYVGFLAYVFKAGQLELDETAIIGMMKIVAPILLVLPFAAVLSAQLSAAVADTSGSGGLIAESTRGPVSHRQGYAVLVAFGLVLTWMANVFEIISYASRALAFYHGLLAAIGGVAAWRTPSQKGRTLAFAALAVLGVLITMFGTAVE